MAATECPRRAARRFLALLRRSQVRPATNPALGIRGGDRNPGLIGADRLSNGDGILVEVAERHLRRPGVIDPMADPAAELRAQRGDPGAEVGAHSLTGHHQVHAERGAQLCQPEQSGGASFGLSAVIPRTIGEVQLRQLIDDHHDRHRSG